MLYVSTVASYADIRAISLACAIGFTSELG